jgi:uncharacterized protein (DUF1697 family)
MAELRRLLESLGCSEVRTLLNSGNAVFQAPGRSTGKWALAIEAAVAGRFGFSSQVLVHTARELTAIVAGNPLLRDAERDPSRFLVVFVASAGDLRKAKPLLAESWSPEQLALGSRAAYLWCATGILESRLLAAVSRRLGSSITTRNWATVLKLQAMVSGDQDTA